MFKKINLFFVVLAVFSHAGVFAKSTELKTPPERISSFILLAVPSYVNGKIIQVALDDHPRKIAKFAKENRLYYRNNRSRSQYVSKKGACKCLGRAHVLSRRKGKFNPFLNFHVTLAAFEQGNKAGIPIETYERFNDLYLEKAQEWREHIQLGDVVFFAHGVDENGKPINKKYYPQDDIEKSLKRDFGGKNILTGYHEVILFGSGKSSFYQKIQNLKGRALKELNLKDPYAIFGDPEWHITVTSIKGVSRDGEAHQKVDHGLYPQIAQLHHDLRQTLGLCSGMNVLIEKIGTSYVPMRKVG